MTPKHGKKSDFKNASQKSDFWVKYFYDIKARLLRGKTTITERSQALL